jgi:hypothetical protein
MCIGQELEFRVQLESKPFGTRISRVGRIFTDFFRKFRENPLYPCNPCTDFGFFKRLLSHVFYFARLAKRALKSSQEKDEYHLSYP